MYAPTGKWSFAHEGIHGPLLNRTENYKHTSRRLFSPYFAVFQQAWRGKGSGRSVRGGAVSKKLGCVHNGTVDRTYSATAAANSKHAHDWGRAISVTMQHLVAQAREAGEEVGDGCLYGEDLHLLIRDTQQGVEIQLTWKPAAPQA